MKDLSVSIGSVTLNNPVMTASGAFGNVKEATDLVDISKLGAVVPKTITRAPRQGNAPPRTVETTAAETLVPGGRGYLRTPRGDSGSVLLCTLLQH